MSTPQFVPGQRWISSTESELGLGIVKDNLGRRVTISFPAAGEERTYAADNAPLTRVQYPIGEEIQTLDGEAMTVTERVERHGLLTYVGQTPGGEPLTIDEIELDCFVQFSTPSDRLFAGQVDKNSSFQLRLEALAHRHRHQQSTSVGFIGPRVQLLEHQLYIASQVAKRFAPRVLLADEVGLGKTIEAGLILHHQVMSGRVNRALILVPDSLVHQWLVEMLRRFNLQFTILDQDRCEALEDTQNANPFETAQLVLSPLTLLTNEPRYQSHVVAAEWDMVIVDEAHHLEWAEDQASEGYRCVEALARQVPGLLLLTATPEQLGVDGHFARLRLLDPDRYYDLAAFRNMEATYKPVSELVASLLSLDTGEQPSETFWTEAQKLLGPDAVHEFRDDLNVEDLVQRLLDCHGTGRVLFRNTRETVGGFPQRILYDYPMAATDDYVAADITVESLLGGQPHPTSDWVTEDARVAWLADWLRVDHYRKALVICARANTAQALEEHLRTRAGIRSAVFHEGMGLVARDRAAAYFADSDESAQILVASEIGSEGRNFQFVHHLILFDLPLNPELLEQRIGRLDRIGQRQTVCIHVPYFEGSAQAVLLRWYHQGMNAFERAFPAGQRVLQAQQDALLQCLRQPEDHIGLEQLVTTTKVMATDLLKRLHEGRDRLLELNSCRTEAARAVVESVAGASDHMALSAFMEGVFDHFGVDAQNDGAASVVLHPGPHMIVSSFPGLPEDGVTATYDRIEALSREDMHFLTWEHPMVRGAMDLVLGGEFGNTALSTLKLPVLKPGRLLLEAIYIMHCAAPRALQLGGFFTQSFTRVVVDESGKDLAKVLTEAAMRKLAANVPLPNAQEIVRHTRTELSKLVTLAAGLASSDEVRILGSAKSEATRIVGAEIERLEALAKINPNIRREEVTYLEQHLELCLEYLGRAQLRLDALRVAIVTQ